MYSVFTANPDIFVVVNDVGFGMDPDLAPFRYSVSDRRVAVARLIGSHSRTTEV